jgi:phosphatidylserine/phosphatidylglycerophosphate/cardiolipin synthase-like enzyme
MHACGREVSRGGDAEKIEWSRETSERGLESECEGLGGGFGGNAQYEGCLAAIVAELGAARSEVLVQAYSFSCPEIANALIAAAARKVRVTILLDRSNEAESYSELGDLAKHGLEVWIDGVHAIAHNKVIVIDGRTVVTGSFNFTRQAEHENAENLLILKDHRELAVRYRANFQAHRDHCHAPGSGKPVHVHARGAADLAGRSRHSPCGHPSAHSVSSLSSGKNHH